jgi:hypothetical protein
MSAITTFSALQARDSVLARAGAALPARDTVDRRIVANVLSGAGRIINSQSEVGGWPVYNPGTAPVDSDHDGMPDSWEQRYELNPSDPDDGTQDADGDGYTNVEECLNQTQPAATTVAQHGWRAAVPTGRYRTHAAFDIRGRRLDAHGAAQGIAVSSSEHRMLFRFSTQGPVQPALSRQ